MSEERIYIEHFERELDIMRATVEKDDELIIEPYVESIKEVCKDFAKNGDTGATASMTASVLANTIKAVLNFQILSPLLGTDDEWKEVNNLGDEGQLFQNIRDTSVFKTSKGCTYSTSIVWKGEQVYDTFTGIIGDIGSGHYIKSFPFMPRTFYIDVYSEPYDENNPKHIDVINTSEGERAYFIENPEQLKEVFNYYNKKEINLKSKIEDDASS